MHLHFMPIKIIMKYLLIHEKDAQVSNWSGGCTTQLYIYPESSEYKKRNFKYRLSMAVAFEEFSTYTSLPGVERHLISLENKAIVSHNGKYDVCLEPYKIVDVFDGGWETTAQGKIKDFNLMTANGAKGKMQVFDEETVFCYEMNCHHAFYIGEGQAQVNGINLNKGDLLLIYEIGDDERLEVKENQNSKIIYCSISL